MANQQRIDALAKLDSEIDKIDTAKLIRNNLGEESLEGSWNAIVPGIVRLRRLIKRYAGEVPDNIADSLTGILQGILSDMRAQAAQNNAEFIQRRQQFLGAINAHLEHARAYMPYLVAAAVLERGFLEDEGIKQEYERTLTSLQKESARSLEQVKQEAEKAVQGAKQIAEEIETRARRTAAKISVEEAQRQFREAAVELRGKVRLWAVLAVLSVLGVLAVPMVFLLATPFPVTDSWPVALYHTVLRVLLFSVMAGLSTFCIRVFRAHLHMAALNMHRIRVANSVESFVSSALEPQQRDLILAKLVEAIVNFGDSGMIKQEKEEIQSPALSAEFIGRVLGGLSAKK